MLAELNLAPTQKQLRQFGFIALGAFALLGGVILWRGGLFGFDFGSSARAVTYVLWTLGGVSALLSVAWPPGNRPLYTALTLIAFPIGFVISHAVLALFFFGILTPVGLVFRLIGRDPLARRFEPDAATYWIDLPDVSDKKDYFRQF